MGLFGLLKNKKKDNAKVEVAKAPDAPSKEKESTGTKAVITDTSSENKAAKTALKPEAAKAENATKSTTPSVKTGSSSAKTSDSADKKTRVIKTTVMVTKVEPKKTLNASTVTSTVVTEESDSTVASEEKTVKTKGSAAKEASSKTTKTSSVKASPSKTSSTEAVAKSNVSTKEAAVEEKPATTEITEGYTGKFEINKSKDGKKFFFNLYASNKVGIASSQMYSSSQGALNGVKSVIANAPIVPIEDQSLKKYEALPYPKWEIYVDNGGKYRFRLSASNGSCVCHSQGYTTKAACKNGIESIIRSSKNAEIEKTYITKKDEN